MRGLVAARAMHRSGGTLASPRCRGYNSGHGVGTFLVAWRIEMKRTCLMTTLVIGTIVALGRGDFPSAARAAEGPAVKIDAAKIGAPISKYIYGQFIEHLGRCIYGGIWSEMLEDRKFFTPVGDKESPWKSLGPADSVAMDAAEPFVGKHTPKSPCPAASFRVSLGWFGRNPTSAESGSPETPRPRRSA